jgi:hypothetical protein
MDLYVNTNASDRQTAFIIITVKYSVQADTPTKPSSSSETYPATIPQDVTNPNTKIQNIPAANTGILTVT